MTEPYWMRLADCGICRKGLFGGGVQMPPPPKVVRMPTEDDPSQRAAAMRFRESTRRRKGRESTILTQQLNDAIGSSGQKLGA